MIIFILLTALFLTPIILAFILLIVIYKYEDLEEKIDKQQRLLIESKRNLLDAENRITQRNKMIEYLEEKNNKLIDKLLMLENYINSNAYGNAETRLNKLKELVSDCESNNQF